MLGPGELDHGLPGPEEVGPGKLEALQPEGEPLEPGLPAPAVVGVAAFARLVTVTELPGTAG